MADEEVGFLGRLTGSSIPEEQIAKQKQRQLIANSSNGDAGLRQMFYGLGRGIGTSAGALAGGLGTGLFGKEQGESFGQAVSRGTQKAQDGATAAGAGISVNELRTRRRIRKELTQTGDLGSGSLDARIRLAQRAAKIASEEGDSASLSRALGTLKALKKEELEFDKLSSGASRERSRAAQEGLIDVYRSDGDPITGVIGNEEGTLEDAGGVGTGVWFNGSDGQLTFERFGDNLSREDPTRASDETVDERIRKLTSTKERELIRNLVVNNDSAMRKSRRVISTLNDLHEKGGAEAVVGASGEAVTFIDNTVRNLRGLVTAFTPPSAMKKDQQVKESWLAKAKDLNDDIWLSLPEEFRRASASATQYRAQIMEMAYMAARLAEPSNRGLSDNDIKNALIRIAGSSSNPQSVIRRFIEMQADSAAELETRISTLSGSISGIPDEEIERVLAGKALPQYRQNLTKLYEDFGIEIGSNGRAIFQEVIDTDVPPGEGQGLPPETTTAPSIDERLEQAKRDLLDG